MIINNLEQQSELLPRAHSGRQKNFVMARKTGARRAEYRLGLRCSELELDVK